MENFEYASRILAAKAMAESVQYMSNRHYLSELSFSDNSILTVGINDNPLVQNETQWIRISQIGKDSSKGIHEHFSIIQKILFSCYDPDLKQVVFMVHGDGEKISLYMGVRFLDGGNIDDTFVNNLSSYINSVCPGTNATFIDDLDKDDFSLKEDILKSKYRKLYSITGIPSFAKEGEESRTSIDTLLGALSKKKFTYYVVADPLSETTLHSIINQCNEMAGQMESVKSYNFSENLAKTENKSYTETKSTYTNWSESSSESKKGTLGQLVFGGLTLAAAACFAPSVSLLPLAVKKIAENRNFGLGFMSTMGILSGFVPQNTKGKINGGGTNTGKSYTEGYSKSQAQTLSLTIVNKQAESVVKKLEQHIQRFESGLGQGMWNVGIYLLTNNSYDAKSASMQLKSNVSGKNTYLEPIRIHDISLFLNRLCDKEKMKLSLASFCSPELPIKLASDYGYESFQNPFENSVSHLTTYMTTEELSCVANFPLRSVPGIDVIDILPDFPMNLSSNDVKGGKSIKLGKLLYGGTTSNVEINLPLDTLSSHALVCGVTGSGKTNTVLGILEGFMLHEKPFLVIEPAKTEYVDWALKYNTTVSDDKRIIVFMPGCTNYLRAQSLKDNGGISYSAYRNGFVPNELRINPFEVISLEGSEMRTISHIDRLKSVFSSAFPMQDVLPVVMERLLYTLYTDKFQLIDKEDRNFMQNGFPTLSDVNKKFICDVIDEIGYGLENTRNISAALHTRFQTLTKGWKGKLLNNKERSLPWEELFGTQGIVINLSFVGDDQDRAFIMNLLLQFLYEYRIAEAEIGNSPENSNGCKHLIVIEEAHRIMSRCDNPEAPIYKSEQMFRDFLSESRNYGQGMMVVDQVPTRLIEDAVKNTNIKIIHKLVAADDSFTIAESVGLTHDQQKVIPKLATGQAIVSGIFGSETKARNNTNVYLAQINKNS